MILPATCIFAFISPLRLEYFSPWAALGLFACLSLPILYLGVRSLNGLGPVRKWVAIGIRLAVLLLMVLILGGLRVERESKNLEVMVLRDISQSTTNVQNFPGQTLQSSLDTYLTDISQTDKPPDDKIGQISFQNTAIIDALPNTHLTLESGAIRDAGNGTDAAAAIQLGLATLQKDAMHRLLLIWDGNATQGDTDAAVAAAAAQHVPIDVMPLHYDVQHEVLMDRMVAPTWKRENEPFSLHILIKSTNTFPVTGKLTVLHQNVPMELDPATPGYMHVTLAPATPGHPSLTPVNIKVPALHSRGVHQFHATFEADADQPDADVTIQTTPTGKNGPANPADTLTSNNSADAFTFVQGKGQILYVDNVDDGTDDRGELLRSVLNEEGVEVTAENHIRPDQFPASLIQLENYDAVILANVPYGPPEGLNEEQQRNLAIYVHDMGGGLVMIGGPETFGAGGWQGKKLEEVLPVNMDIPAQRQIPKGALVMVMHACEFPEGNYYGQQCCIKAIETLSSMDEVGIVSFGFGGGGSNWDFPLGPKGDGTKPIAAAKAMQVGDMPSFEESMNFALYGAAGQKGLKDSDAKQKHVIIISDGDPSMPSDALMQAYHDAKITVSTVSVFPHNTDGTLPPTMKDIARRLKGKAYGPINSNPNQLPQIFVKEATVVRRSLISEDESGIPLKRTPSSSDLIKGLGELPPVKGLVLTSRKSNPQIEIPIVAGRNNDPALAIWQTGLGRAVVYTSDATNRWGAWWVESPDFNKFWAQIVRSVARPPMSTLFDITTTQSGDKGHIVVEALDKESGFQNFLNIAGTVAGPDPSKPPVDTRLVQTGPGRYEGTFDTPDPGTYVAALQYIGPNGQKGTLLSGVAMNDSPEMRDLQSNDALLQEIADRTGGRVLTPFDVATANLFDHQGLPPAISPLPVWDTLIPFLLALILLDVATRRIAWDWTALKAYVSATEKAVKSYTTTRKIDTRASLDALKKVREDATTLTTGVAASAATSPSPRDPKAKFEPKTQTPVEGDISTIVGGATDKPLPAAPKKIEPKGAPGGMGSLMEAKRRAQEQIKKKEKGEER